MATNEQLIPIPGRLHSLASEGHVAGADEIYDDTQGKLQSTINTEKADKSATVSGVSYDTTNKKIQQTINGTTTDVVSVSTLKTDMSLQKSDVGLGNVENKSSATIRGELTSSDVTTALGYTPPQQDTTYSVMGASGSTHASGLVPDTPTTAGTTKFLREDGTWQEVNAAPEVQIGGSTPSSESEIKLFVDEDADPAGAIDIYNKTQVDTLLNGKADTATTISGYGITDAYTKTQIDALTRHTRLTDFDLNDLKKAVADQNLEKYGLKVGDQKTINGHDYVIAGLNPMKGTEAPYRVTTNHVGLIVIPHTTQAWNASGNTAAGADNRGAGYLNSDLHYYLKNTLLSLVETDLGAANLIGHSKLLTNAVNTTAINRLANDSNKGASSGGAWENTKICALSEVQVYGAAIWSSSGYDTGEACRQLDVFQRYSHTEIFGGEYPLLRDVVSASNAAYANNDGRADRTAASNAYYVAALILFH